MDEEAGGDVEAEADEEAGDEAEGGLEGGELLDFLVAAPRHQGNPDTQEGFPGF